jgi:hypothetical protein
MEQGVYLPEIELGEYSLFHYEIRGYLQLVKRAVVVMIDEPPYEKSRTPALIALFEYILRKVYQDCHIKFSLVMS